MQLPHKNPSLPASGIAWCHRSRPAQPLPRSLGLSQSRRLSVRLFRAFFSLVYLLASDTMPRFFFNSTAKSGAEPGGWRVRVPWSGVDVSAANDPALCAAIATMGRRSLRRRAEHSVRSHPRSESKALPERTDPQSGLPYSYGLTKDLRVRAPDRTSRHRRLENIFCAKGVRSIAWSLQGISK